MKTPTPAPLVAVCLLLISACAQKTAKINTFADPTFRGGQIRAVAVFPILNAKLAPGEAHQINRGLTTRIAAQNPGVRLVGPNESVTRLNEQNLAETWATFLANYTASGIPDARMLREIGKGLGIDGILQGEVLNISQQDGFYGVRFGDTLVSVRFTLLDVHTGKLLWDASSEGRSTTATTVEAAPPLAEAVELAVNKILETMPRL